MTGHELLLKDLSYLLKEATDFQFHDYKNTDHAVPKVVLVQKLEHLTARVKNGTYDNQPDAEDNANMSTFLKNEGFSDSDRKKMFGLD